LTVNHTKFLQGTLFGAPLGGQRTLKRPPITGPQNYEPRRAFSSDFLNPNICFGKPCTKGQRIWVWLVLDQLASGWSFQQVLENYPGITEDDIRACIAYGAEISASGT
jgi:uncharacterized protein (DUF433 family)